ncbi:MAG TPA: UDP-N-acetylmuramoyl-L-alanine--D-glutamate ligase [Lachnospiraceae bacterium]|nr:UDP-N-acetylmuramoyl-L-alanine--D-glutamate ligase [Lachnospiraceae bacterium]
MRFDGKTFLVAGTGKSGVAAVSLLASKGAEIIVTEGNDKLSREEVMKRFPANAGFKLVIGEADGSMLEGVDIAVISPGVPVDSPLVLKLKEKKIPVWGEVELAYVCGKGKVYAITGTNGKTTTTALTGEIMKSYFNDVFVVGNIGVPYTEYAEDMKDSSVTVAEISSFQLETIHTFKPEISAILNITPDHLNRHHTMECYVDTKAGIARNQGPADICVLNYEDVYLRNIAKDIKADVFWFSSGHILERGIWMEDEEIIYSDTDSGRINICNIHDMKLLGRHNYENVMAAVAIAMHAGVPVGCIRKSVKEFNAVEHRIEFVREVNGVKYYNDSKGTNPDAAIKAVEAMVRPVVLIGGGYDKQSSYDEWIASFKDKVKCLVLLGATADKIAAAALKAGFNNIIKVSSIEEAVRISSRQAADGDAVLLSPACASWDMFKSYEERGDIFKKYVNSL